jgi:hypothetical protein
MAFAGDIRTLEDLESPFFSSNGLTAAVVPL